MTVGLSLVGHALVFGAQLILPGQEVEPNAARPVKLIYEPPARQEETRWAPQELRRAYDRMRDLPSRASLSAAAATPDAHLGEGALRAAVATAMSAIGPQIRIGTGPGALLPSLATGGGAWATAIDLTNLADAAQGNPVLLSYFSAIREQIQQTANGQSWRSETATDGGIVCVGFDLSHTGEIRSLAIIADRSASSSVLRETALRIVRSSGPFPPFPPSFREHSKTIVIPLEFIGTRP